MKSRVFFIPVSETDQTGVVEEKIRRLLTQSRVLDCVSQGDTAAVKIHFGEEGNTGFVKPVYARAVCEAVSGRGGRPRLAETNTLYKGRRTDSGEHLVLAAEHGFTEQDVGAPIVIPDDSLPENVVDVPIGRRLVKTAKIVRFFAEADAIVGLSHFKGHLMTGFGGALKNLGMGCAARVGKLMQHSDISPIVHRSSCTGCGECVKVCPVTAIRLENKKSVIDGDICIGCATCIAVCPFSAIDVQWESGGDTMPEKMVEYTEAVMRGKKEKAAFLNFAIKITKECDCLAKDDPRVCPDIGILASRDPVSVDQASFDLIKQACGRDIFKELHPKRDGMRQLRYAEELGLGSREYELIRL